MMTTPHLNKWRDSKRDFDDTLEAVIHCCTQDSAKACEVKGWLESLPMWLQDQAACIRTDLLRNMPGAQNDIEAISVAEKRTSAYIILRSPQYEEDSAALRLGRMLMNMSVHSQDIRVIQLATGHSVEQLFLKDRAAAITFAFDYKPTSSVFRQLMFDHLTKDSRHGRGNLSGQKCRTAQKQKPKPQILVKKRNVGHSCEPDTELRKTYQGSTYHEMGHRMKIFWKSEISGSRDSLDTQSSFSSIRKEIFHNGHLSCMNNRLCENEYTQWAVFNKTTISEPDFQSHSEDGSDEDSDFDSPESCCQDNVSWKSLGLGFMDSGGDHEDAFSIEKDCSPYENLSDHKTPSTGHAHTHATLFPNEVSLNASPTPNLANDYENLRETAVNLFDSLETVYENDANEDLNQNSEDLLSELSVSPTSLVNSPWPDSHSLTQEFELASSWSSADGISKPFSRAKWHQSTASELFFSKTKQYEHLVERGEYVYVESTEIPSVAPFPRKFCRVTYRLIFHTIGKLVLCGSRVSGRRKSRVSIILKSLVGPERETSV